MLKALAANVRVVQTDNAITVQAQNFGSLADFAAIVESEGTRIEGQRHGPARCQELGEAIVREGRGFLANHVSAVIRTGNLQRRTSVRSLDRIGLTPDVGGRSSRPNHCRFQFNADFRRPENN